MNKKQIGRWLSAALLLALGGMMGRAGDLAITSFDGTGRLSYNTLNNGTNYNYRVEWAPSPGGPWNDFGSAAAFWLNARPQIGGSLITNTVPMCYRVVATLGDYLAIDISGGTGAVTYPVTYYRTLADVPDGANSDTYKTTNMLMRLIPKGTFTMGGRTTDYPGASEFGLHQVTLTQDFYMGVFEVTQRQWELVMGNKPSYFHNATYYAKRPVEQVSYDDIRGTEAQGGGSWPTNGNVYAASFMGKLRTKTGLAGFDLPTESQWEYACRAGTTTALNSGYNLTSTDSDSHMSEVGRYQFNNSGGYSASRSVNTEGGTSAAGTYLPNAWGLYDMHGNVWEWCLDWEGGWYSGTVTDPFGPTSGFGRMPRGGSWIYGAGGCRVGSRTLFYEPDGVADSIGFRASRTLP